MSTYKQPIGQKRLTNIVVVRVRKHGQRFEVACYRNKVMSWRAGIEKDIDEVLQAHTIFSNVGKGTLAKAADLIKAFGTDDEDVICRKILAEGEYQVSDKEREMVSSGLHRDVLFLVMERTVNPETLRPYSLGMIEKFAQEVHFAVDPGKNSKQQALDLIRQLVQRFPIARAQMEMRLTLPSAVAAEGIGTLQSELDTWKATVCSKAIDAGSGQTSLVVRVDPGMYRQCDAWTKANGGRLEVTASAVQANKDVTLDRLEDGLQAMRLQPGLTEREEPAASETSTEQRTQGASAPEPSLPEISGEGRTSAAAKPIVSTAVKCTTCSVEIESRDAYRDHCKSEWHKHNMRRKARQFPPLSKEECEVDTELMNDKPTLGDF